jgi:alpha-galactosidase
LGWSGNQRLWIEHHSTGITGAGSGELLAPGEVVLSAGESYSTPWLYGSWSDQGLDGISQRFHSYIRRTTGSNRRAHPLILNTWEAVYFDHNDDALSTLATLGAELGVERLCSTMDGCPDESMTREDSATGPSIRSAGRAD